jgi:hypothetical protein
MPTTSDYIALLYKKFLGSPNGYPDADYLGDIPLVARPNITQNQIFGKPIPSTVPAIGTLVDITSHPSTSASPSKIWNGTGAISSLGKTSKGSTPYTYLTYYQDLVLVMENEGVSYTCMDRATNINIFARQVPFNLSTSLVVGSYNPTIKIWTKSGGTFTSQTAGNNAPTRQWILDQDAGVITFYGTSPIDTSTQYVTASFWRYDGLTGVIDGGSASSTYA